jgi:hypothetical protein
LDAETTPGNIDSRARDMVSFTGQSSSAYLPSYTHADTKLVEQRIALAHQMVKRARFPSHCQNNLDATPHHPQYNRTNIPIPSFRPWQPPGALQTFARARRSRRSKVTTL